MTSPTVTYTVKELLAQLHDKVDGIGSKVDRLDERLAIQEFEADHRARRRAHLEWLIGAIATVVIAVATVVAVVH